MRPHITTSLLGITPHHGFLDIEDIPPWCSFFLETRLQSCPSCLSCLQSCPSCILPCLLLPPLVSCLPRLLYYYLHYILSIYYYYSVPFDPWSICHSASNPIICRGQGITLEPWFFSLSFSLLSHATSLSYQFSMFLGCWLQIPSHATPTVSWSLPFSCGQTLMLDPLAAASRPCSPGRVCWVTDLIYYLVTTTQASVSLGLLH